MYRVTVENNGIETVIHSPYPDALKLESGVITNKINEISTFSFVGYPDIELNAKFYPLTTIIRVFNTKTRKFEFQGRLLDPIDEFSSAGLITKKFECESELAYLHDTYLTYQEFNGKLSEVIAQVLLLHNGLVESHKHFQIGNIEQVKDLMVNFYSVPETSTYSLIFDEIVAEHDLVIDYSNDNGVLKLNLYKDYGKRSEVDIELTINMVSMSRETKAQSIVTRVIPLGDRVARSDIKEKDIPQDRVTIASVNGGRVYLDDPILIQGDGSRAGFGIQMQPKIFEGVTNPNELKNLGSQFLAEQRQKLVLNTYQVEALNLFLIDLVEDDYILGNYHRVYNYLLGIDEVLQIVGSTVDIVMPSNTKIVIGDKWASLEDYQRQALNYNKRLWKFNEYIWRQNEINRMQLEEQDKILEKQNEMIESLEQIQENQGNALDNLARIMDDLYKNNSSLKPRLDMMFERIYRPSDGILARLTALENR